MQQVQNQKEPDHKKPDSPFIKQKMLRIFVSCSRHETN
jgi:hypothetical protein